MRVIGSHAISTMPVLSALMSAGLGWVVVMGASPHLLVAGGQLAAPLAPVRLRVELLLGDLAEPSDDAAHRLAGGAGHERAGGASMNGWNLSGKPGIVQPMQMPP